jgi:hypothetical protein
VGVGDMNRRYGAINLAKSLGGLKLASFVKLYSDEGDSYLNTTDPAGKTVTERDPAKTMDGTLSARLAQKIPPRATTWAESTASNRRSSATPIA